MRHRTKGRPLAKPSVTHKNICGISGLCVESRLWVKPNPRPIDSRAISRFGQRGEPFPCVAKAEPNQIVFRLEGERAGRVNRRIVVDSRLLPGETATLTLPWGEHTRARMWLEVWPDHYYDTQVYDAVLAGLVPGSPAADLISSADRAAQESNYRLFVTEVAKP